MTLIQAGTKDSCSKSLAENYQGRNQDVVMLVGFLDFRQGLTVKYLQPSIKTGNLIYDYACVFELLKLQAE